MRRQHRLALALSPVALLFALLFARVAAAPTPGARGTFVLTNNGYRDGGFSPAYPQGLWDASGYAHTSGLAVFVPLARALPSAPDDWSSWAWDWSFLDAMIGKAEGRQVSLAFVSGFNSPLPDGFELACSGGPPAQPCAPLFHTWTSTSVCIENGVPLPWNLRVQTFWVALAQAAAAHLQATGAYAQVSLVHLPGLSVYDEELRLPNAALAPPPDAGVDCPVAAEATLAAYQAAGFTSESDVVAGWHAIGSAWASAFPDKVLAASLFPRGSSVPLDFPDFVDPTPGHLAWLLVQDAATSFAAGRLLLQADMIGTPSYAAYGYVMPEVGNYAGRLGTLVGWQTTSPGQSFVQNDSPPDPASYFELLLDGWQDGGARYVEVYSHDVIAYPQSFAASDDAGLFH